MLKKVSAATIEGRKQVTQLIGARSCIRISTEICKNSLNFSWAWGETGLADFSGPSPSKPPDHVLLC